MRVYRDVKLPIRDFPNAVDVFVAARIANVQEDFVKYKPETNDFRLVPTENTLFTHACT